MVAEGVANGAHRLRGLADDVMAWSWRFLDLPRLLDVPSRNNLFVHVLEVDLNWQGRSSRSTGVCVRCVRSARR